MKLIKVAASRKPAIVDDEDFPLVSKHKWRLHRDGWAYTPWEGHAIGMHRLIINAPKGIPVDHKNRIKLDNRRENLRFADYAKNSQNRVKSKRRKPCSSRFKGVYWKTDLKIWAAYITANGNRIHLGIHKKQKDAAAAYNRAAIQWFGEFACLNKL